MGFSMAIVIVSGGGRGVGKTALICAMISALPEFKWIAAKVTAHSHGTTGPEILEEKEPGDAKDTARYLAAGAQRSFLLSSAVGQEIDTSLFESWLANAGKAHIIFESNTVLNFVQSELCLVLAGNADGKASYGAAFERADAVVVAPRSNGLLASLAGEMRPVFQLEPNDRLTPAFAQWIRDRLIYR